MPAATVTAVADAAAAAAAAVLIVTYSISDDRYRYRSISINLPVLFDLNCKKIKQPNNKQFYTFYQLCAYDDIPSSSPALLPFHLSLFYVSSIIFLHSITYIRRRRPANDVWAIIRTQDHSCCLLLHHTNGLPIDRGATLAAELF